MSALRELLAIFDIKVDDHELKEGHKHVESFEKKLAEVAKTVTEVFAVEQVKEFVESQIEAAAHVQDLADRLDLSATAIRNFGFAAQGAGVDLDSSARALGFLEKNLGDAALKGGDAAAMFAHLGVPLKDADGKARGLNEVLGDVAEGISKLPDQNQRAAVSMQLFGREGRALIPVLKGGKEGLEKLLEEATELGNGLGDDYYKNAKKAREASEKIDFVWQSMKDRIMSALLPAVDWLQAKLLGASKWMLAHAKATKVLELGLAVLAVVIGAALTDALLSAAAAAWALLAPFALLAIPAAAVAAFVWVIQDLVTLLKDGDSVIGNFVEQLGGVEAKTALVEALRDAWGELKGDIDSAAYGVGYFLGVVVGVGKAVENVLPFGEFFKDLGIDIDGVNVGALAFVSTMKLLADTVINMVPGLRILIEAGKAFALIHGNRLALSAAGDALDEGDVDTEAPKPGAKPRNPTSIQRDRGRSPRSFTRESTAAPSGYARNPVSFERGSTVVRLPAAPHVGGNVVHQSNVNHVQVHTSSDRPREVGDAVGAGVATRTQKDLNNAHKALNRP